MRISSNPYLFTHSPGAPAGRDCRRSFVPAPPECDVNDPLSGSNGAKLETCTFVNDDDAPSLYLLDSRPTKKCLEKVEEFVTEQEFFSEMK